MLRFYYVTDYELYEYMKLNFTDNLIIILLYKKINFFFRKIYLSETTASIWIFIKLKMIDTT